MVAFRNRLTSRTSGMLCGPVTTGDHSKESGEDIDMGSSAVVIVNVAWTWTGRSSRVPAALQRRAA
jgi:hypothetical protein